MRIGADDEKIVIGAQPPCLERPSVATHVRELGHDRDERHAQGSFLADDVIWRDRCGGTFGLN